MSEVTKQDIAEVHTRIDKGNATMTKIQISLARIETKFEMLPGPPTRPCHYHADLKTEVDDHMESHKETKKLFQTPIVKTVIDLAKMAVVAAVTWLFVRRES